MTIIFLHGEDELKSYERLQKFIDTAQKRSWEVSWIDDSSLTLEETLSATSLFNGQRFFVLTDIKKLGKEEIAWLKKKIDDLNGNLIIYHSSVAPISLIKALPEQVKFEEFKLPKRIFEFLDSFIPGNPKKVINLLHEVSNTQPGEFVFSLLAKQLRDLYWAIVDPKSLPYPSWRVGKLKAQGQKFNVNRLTELIGQLSEIDIVAKTSKTEIIPSLDLLIATKLE